MDRSQRITNLNGVIQSFNVLDSVSNFASALAGVIDKDLRENAQIEVRNAQMQYEQDAARFLTELENSNDYENWESKANNFLTEYSNKLQAGSKNAYTAKLMQEQMTANSTNMNVNLINAVNRGMRKERIAESEKSLTLIKENYKGQEQIDKSMEVLDFMYKKGDIDRANYEKMSRSVVMNASYDGYNAQANNMVNDAITNGQSKYQLSQMLNNMSDEDLDFATLLTGSGSVDTVDKEGGKQKLTSEERAKIKKDIIAAAENNYDVRVKEMQTNNERDLADIYSRMLYAENDAVREQIRREGKATLDKMVETNELNLSSSDFKTYSRYFAPDKPKTTRSGSGGSTNAPKINIKSQVERNLDLARLGESSAQLGHESAYVVLDSIPDMVDEAYKAKGYKPDPAERQAAISQAYIDGVGYAIKSYKADDNIKATMEQAENYAKTLMKKGDYALSNEISMRLLDYIMDNDVSKLNAEKVKRDMKKEIDGVIVASLAYKGTFEKDSPIEGVAKFLYDVKENHLMRSDQKGNPMFTGNITKATVDSLDVYVKDKFLANWGIDPATVVADWESDGKHDYSGDRVYTTQDGRQFKPVAFKNANGDMDIQIMYREDSNSKYQKLSTSDKVSIALQNKKREKDAHDKKRAEEAEKRKLLDEQIKANKTKYEQKRKDEEIDKGIEYAAELKWEDLSQGMQNAIKKQFPYFQPSQWNQNPSQRKSWLSASQEIKEMAWTEANNRREY